MTRALIVEDDDARYEQAMGPGEVIDLVFDWSRVLPDDTIESSTWEIGDGLTAANDSTLTDFKTTAWVTGGSLGQYIACVNQIVTEGGRTYRRTVYVRVDNR